ncbi:phage tape measure protein [Ancylobacter novellus DSM 506]|uniref:Phage tape measure protein n=1 Tax=Ancylobacter novellus (strain ATCC 8093 / DSM 506 / JCM 20403 / CCM 1077 / IAM 12100 / NBRC 12443 / NCIMB 10456) TaxID=639283 RepID=D6ZZU7_ANCN5|nr:tape measure protein [Ancylobacter novellus]ADH87361.1 phage tape measure protein [Ancylobacter novellus DSM 506]
MATDIEKLVVQMSADIKGFERELRKAQGIGERRATAIERRFQQMNKRISASLGSSVSLGGLAGAVGLGISIADFVETTKRIDSLRQSLKAITGSEAEAAREMQFVTETAEKLGLELLSTGEAYASLMAATKDTTLEGEATRDIFVAVANAMSTLGKSSADTEAALLAVQQMVSKGKVSAEELRGQLGERLPGAFKAAADALGITTAELDEMLQKGQVTAEVLLPRLAKRLEELYSVDRKSTLTAEINRLNNAVTDLYRTLADTGAIGLVTSALKDLANIIKEIAAYSQLVGQGRFGEAFAVDPAGAARMKLRLGQGTALTDDQSAAWDQAFGMTGSAPSTVTVNKPAPPAFAPAAEKQRLDSYQRLTAAIKERTGAIEAETAAQASLNPLMNDYGFAVEKARAEYDLLTAAQEAGLSITPELRAQIDTLATAYANASAASEQLRESQGRLQQAAADFNEMGRGVLSGFIADFTNAETRADALNNAIGRIVDSLAEMALSSVFKPQGSGSGGLFGAFFSALTGGTSGTTSGYAGASALYDEGGYTGDGGKHDVAGAVHRGEYVFSKAAVQRLGADNLEMLHLMGKKGYADGGFVGGLSMPRISRRGGASRGAGAVLSFSPVTNIDATGSQVSRQEIAGMLAQRDKALMAGVQRAMPGWIVSARKRNVGI